MMNPVVAVVYVLPDNILRPINFKQLNFAGLGVKARQHGIPIGQALRAAGIVVRLAGQVII